MSILKHCKKYISAYLWNINFNTKQNLLQSKSFEKLKSVPQMKLYFFYKYCNKIFNYYKLQNSNKAVYFCTSVRDKLLNGIKFYSNESLKWT